MATDFCPRIGVNRSLEIRHAIEQMLSFFRASGIRPTLLIFTADDSTAKDSARFKSDSFKATPLYDQFVAHNSPTLVVPWISAGTLNTWEGGRAPSTASAAGHWRPQRHDDFSTCLTSEISEGSTAAPIHESRLGWVFEGQG